MSTSRSAIGIEQLNAALAGGDGTLAMAALFELEEQVPSKFIIQTLESLLPKIRDEVIAFQARKTLRILSAKISGDTGKASLGILQELISQPDRLDDLACLIANLTPTDSILATDMLRTANWREFPAAILPTFCRYFRKYGNVVDADALIELSRHSDPIVMTAAIEALEVVDPTNLQSLITPLLTSPNPGIRAKAIQTLYRWDKASALHFLVTMLFSKDPTEQALALHHSVSFPYREVESHLLRFIAETEDPKLLMKTNMLLKSHAHTELPFRLYWIFRNLKGTHKDLVKGIIIGIIRTLSDKRIILIPPENYLEQLKQRIREVEEQRLRDSMALLPEEKESEPVSDLPPSSPVTAAPSPGHSFNSIDDYDKLDTTVRVQLLTKLTSQEYDSFKSRIPSLLKSSEGKELAALIRVVGRFGVRNESEGFKTFLSHDDPDIVCAGIDALATLDAEYLSIFLPQLMQSKNGKIRIKATRAFVGIDREQIKSLLAGMLNSNPKQRAMAIPISTLVDFGIVREPLMKALEKETLPDMVEKIGAVICANPDREIFRELYRMMKASHNDVKSALDAMVKQCAQKLSVVLGKISSPEELIAGEETAFTVRTMLAADKNKAAGTASQLPPLQSGRPSGDKPPEKKAPMRNEPVSVKEILSSNDESAKDQRANITVGILIAGGMGWLAMMAYFFLNR